MITLFNYLLISNIFTGGFVFYNGYFDFFINFIFMVVFLFAYIIFYKEIVISRNLIYILMFAFLVSSINVLLSNTSTYLLLKTLIPFIFNALTYYLLIRLNDYNVDKLFRIYLKMAVIVASIGIFQEISFIVGFKPGYDFKYFIPRIVDPSSQLGLLRITSIMPEPSNFSTAMAPAIFISLLSLIGKKNSFIGKKASFLIIISTLLTFAVLSYIGIVAALILIMLNYKKIRLVVICTIIVTGLAFTSYTYVPMIKRRVDDTVAVVSGKKPLEKVNLSTFAFCSNGFVAYKSFRNNPLIGSGLGSHPLLYDRYISQIIDPEKIIMVLNREDASALFLRLISEMGLVGIFLFFYFIVKFYVTRAKDGYFWIISNAILCLFISNLLRHGNYFHAGLILFIFMYYFTGKNICIKTRHNC